MVERAPVYEIERVRPEDRGAAAAAPVAPYIPGAPLMPGMPGACARQMGGVCVYVCVCV